jgi:hypothetical protein
MGQETIQAEAEDLQRNPELRVQNANYPKRVRYLYEERVWRYTRTVSASGSGQGTVHDPQYTLMGNEEARGKQESYQARFFSERDGYYTARVRFAQWQSLRAAATYRLGCNAFGRVRTVKPARPAPEQRTPESVQRDS